MSRNNNGHISELAYRARHLIKYSGRLQVKPQTYDSRNVDFRSVIVETVYISLSDESLHIIDDHHTVMISEDHRVVELHQERLLPALLILRRHMVLQDLADV